MLPACALEFKGSWDRMVKLMEFSYDNSDHSGIGIALFEALYGRKCRSLLYQDEVGEKLISKLDLVEKTVEKIRIIKDKLKMARDLNKSWADTKRRLLEFKQGDKVYLKISLSKSVMRFGKSGKLSPRYIGPFEIFEKVGNMVYHLAIPPSLSKVHNIFQVSQFRKYVSDPSHMLEAQPLEVRETHLMKCIL